jgi:hypothetical protein
LISIEGFGGADRLAGGQTGAHDQSQGDGRRRGHESTITPCEFLQAIPLRRRAGFDRFVMQVTFNIPSEILGR